MSRRDFWICICVILTIFILGIAVGMSMKVLGVDAAETEAESEAEAEEHISGMPCENPKQFERWYETYEQKTGEEEVAVSNGEEPNPSEAKVEVETTPFSSVEDTEKNVPEVPVLTEQHGSRFSETKKVVNYEQTTSEEATEKESFSGGEDDKNSEVAELPTEMETSEESVAGIEMETGEESITVYTVNGELIDPVIQQKLYNALEKHGIGYWYEGALAQMYQESGGNPMIVNPTNGIDTGLFQYREPFWDYSRGDIFDPEAQIELYVEETAARINAGLTVDEVISRHFTSDYVTEVDWEYVQQVKQWLNKIEKF